METKDTAIALEMLLPEMNTEEGNIVQDLKNIDNSSPEESSLIKQERSQSIPTVDLKHDLDPDESTGLNPPEVQEESSEDRITVDIGQHSNPTNSKCRPDQGNANINVQLPTTIYISYSI